MNTYAAEQSFHNFERCAEVAPRGAYEQAKEIRQLIGDACDNLIRDLRATGMKADNCDRIRKVELAMYAYVKESNPDDGVFAVSEGFGSAMDGPAAERVMEQTFRDMFFLLELGIATP